MNKIYFTLIAFAFYHLINAQQTPVFSEYHNNPLIINSAFTGLKNNAELSLSANGFMSDIEGSPLDVKLTYNKPIERNNMGIGGGIIYDRIGVSTINSFFLSYSYHIVFDHKSYRPDWDMYKENVLSFGITVGGQMFQENLLELNQTEDPHFDENTATFKPNIGAGVVLNHKKFYIGLSATNLLDLSDAKKDEIDFESPFFGYLGLRLYTDRYEKASFNPSLLVKYVEGAPIQTDFNIAFNYDNKFEIGTGYRTQNQVNFLVGLFVKEKFKFVYQYQHALLDSPFKSGHGIILNYGF